MLNEGMPDDRRSRRFLWQQKLMRSYLSGIGLVAILFLMGGAWFRIAPWFSSFENPTIAMLIASTVLIVVTPLLGLFVQTAINPVLGRWSIWSELVRLEERLAGELTADRALSVVLVNSPSESERTIGVMTNTFPATDTLPEMASVYIPMGPQGKTGYIRILQIGDVQVTGWNIREFQLYQLTMGAVAPPELIQDD